jgi:hypothetical protein
MGDRANNRLTSVLILLVLALIVVTLLVFGILFARLSPQNPMVIGITGGASPTAEAKPVYLPTWMPLPAATAMPTRIQVATPTRALTQATQPTLAEFWDGKADFVLEVRDTGLPMGESDTIVMPNGEFWSYVHASQRSAGTIDRCGRPVEFPGCVVIYRSLDGGHTFHHDQPPVCLFECRQCPCDSENDHIDQQQYPRVYRDRGVYVMVYEYRARVMLRRSSDGLTWSQPEELPFSGIWTATLRGCPVTEKIGMHPFVAHEYDCLAGGPPGLFMEDGWIYVFVAAGQNPGGLGCYYGAVDAPALRLRKSFYYPLITGATEYGPLQARGPEANAFFDFRTISSAEVQRVGRSYYVLYEGIRGPGSGDPGDTQFGLGLARSMTSRIDGPWEKYPGNPILEGLPGNIGLGHADLVVVDGVTILYTSLDGVVRSRLVLVWK